MKKTTKAKTKPAAKKAAKPAAKKVVKKAPAKKAPVKKAPVKKAPAKKAPIKKAPAKKVPAKKAPIKKPTPKVASKSIKKAIAKPIAKPAPKPAAKPEVKAKASSQEQVRYSDKDLNEFKAIILRKKEDAMAELQLLTSSLHAANEHGTDDTAATFKMMEDGSESLAKEEAAQQAARQKKFIEQLDAALVRIANKTYGICRVTGKLIPKERLRAVPHTTQSMEAKLKQYRD